MTINPGYVYDMVCKIRNDVIWECFNCSQDSFPSSKYKEKKEDLTKMLTVKQNHNNKKKGEHD